MSDNPIIKAKNLINSKIDADKDFYLALLDDEKQSEYENNHLSAVMFLLRAVYINKHLLKIRDNKQRIETIKTDTSYTASDYVELRDLVEENKKLYSQIEDFKCFFDEPYFARMDLFDEKEGYNSYYIGKKGDVNLEIVDWRAPLAKKYYQKSQINFTINDYTYKLILRRALRTKNGKLLDFKNEYLSLKEYLSKEEIAGRDEEIIFDPFLKDILKSRKEQSGISDIIETIQEKQYEIITLPERENFVLQGCAGSGKTMILLHRLSYLMYNNEKIKPRDVVVITPSNSFNDFIDELSTILELEKVQTITIQDYFADVLKNAGIDLSGKIDPSLKEDKEYLRYVYSDKFVKEVQKFLNKTYDSIFGLMSSKECKESVAKILRSCEIQNSEYNYIKNASIRVRRAVLGEIKEKEGGGLYYTKPYRALMNSLLEVQEFLKLDISQNDFKSESVFYKNLHTFYVNARYVVKYNKRISDEAIYDLDKLSETIDKELSDLRRYKSVRGGKEFDTFPDRIQRRIELKEEIEKIKSRIIKIYDNFIDFVEFFEILRGEKAFVLLGNCSTNLESARYFYKETVKKIKKRFNMTEKHMYNSDNYALCMILALMGYDLEPRFTLVFVDEGQDISANEYKLLQLINKNATFNIFGDLSQNITDYRGLKVWDNCLDSEKNANVYYLNQNYRNTNQIVKYVGNNLKIDMQPIGFDWQEVVKTNCKNLSKFFNQSGGLKAVITSLDNLEKYAKKSYNLVKKSGKISKNRINIMTVYESKGLEFSSVAVVDNDLSDNEKYIAYTRALKELAIIDDGADKNEV